MPDKIATHIDGVALSLSNLDKPLFSTGFTKGELISYYVDVAPALLPHLRDRAVTRVRFPHGAEGASFFEKNAPAGTPDWVERVRVATSVGTVDYVVANDRATLAWLANLAAIELHTPQWRITDATQGPDGIALEGDREPRATSLIVDLDPGPGITPADSARGAILAATLLAEVGLESFPKTSGNKGLQLSVPIAPTPVTLVHAFAASAARQLAQRYPKTFTATMSKEARSGLLFVDYAQNLAARNTVSAYSVRGLMQPSVATPLTWDEVAAIDGSSPLRIAPAEVLTRLDRYGDVWASALPSEDSPELPAPLT